MSLYADYLHKERKDFILKILPVIRTGFRTRADDLKTWTEQDWQQISWFAQQHRVLPILWHNLKKNSLTGQMPSKIADFLSRQYLMIVSRNLRLARGLVDILAHLHDRNIPVVPYKGPVLAQAVYGDFGLRYYQDLDILAPAKQLPEVWQLLYEAGFKPYKPPFTQEGFLSIARYGNEFSFTDLSGIINIDLHWKINKHSSLAFDLDFCSQRLKQVSFEDKNIWNLSVEDTVLALCLNGGNDLWPDLEGILVLADLIAAEPDLDWDLLQSLANRLKCERMLLLGLFLSMDLFDVNLPKTIAERIDGDEVIRGLSEKVYGKLFQNRVHFSAFEHFLLQIKLRQYSMDKLEYMFRRIFYPTQKDWIAWPKIKKRSYLFFLLRPLRLCACIVKGKHERYLK